MSNFSPNTLILWQPVLYSTINNALTLVRQEGRNGSYLTSVNNPLKRYSISCWRAAGFPSMRCCTPDSYFHLISQFLCFCGRASGSTCLIKNTTFLHTGQAIFLQAGYITPITSCTPFKYPNI